VLDFRPSLIHGQGAFAQRPIAAGTRVIEYIGEKIDKRESILRCEQNNAYIFYLDEDFDLDGNVSWNPARLINHSCSPNCDAELDEGRIWIIAQRDIAAGEELTFNYGYSLDEFREHPCRCGASECIGYILAEEYHASIRALGLHTRARVEQNFEP
jgi:hypothetical protein